MNNIQGPLPPEHPLVTDHTECPWCGHKFVEYQRVVLVPIKLDKERNRAECIPVHASCAYGGLISSKGLIEKIMDGDANPYPVVTSQGQFKPEEVEAYAQWEFSR